jgi:hypothetical protein
MPKRHKLDLLGCCLMLAVMLSDAGSDAAVMQPVRARKGLYDVTMSSLFKRN